MTAPKKEKYLVIVRSAPPKRASLGQQQQGISLQSYAAQPSVTVKEVEATSPQAAADLAGVPPGATARVVLAKYVKTFKRPEKAPLVAA